MFTVTSHAVLEPVGPADAHAMPVAAEKDTDAAIAIARILRRQLLHPLDHARVLHRLAALVAQRRSRHREQRAGPSYRETTLPAIRNLTPTSRHAHQFFAATSFITSISRSRSATSFFSRAFSASSCFSRRTSFDCNPPNRLRQRRPVQGRLRRPRKRRWRIAIALSFAMISGLVIAA